MKSADRVELMGMLGLFGAIVSAIQMYPYSITIAVKQNLVKHNSETSGPYASGYM